MPSYLPGVNEFKHARVNATTEGGENSIISAPTGKAIAVLGYMLTANAEGLVTLKDSGATYASFYAAKAGGAAYGGGNEAPAFVLGAEKALVLETAGSQKVAGHITYALI